MDELNGILREHVLIRRLKSEVLHDLPSMRRTKMTIVPDKDCLPVSPVLAGHVMKSRIQEPP